MGLDSEGWNFGPEPQDEATVRELVERIVAAWGEGTWEDRSASDAPAEAGVLRLSNDAAVSQLGWRPRWSLNEAIDRTVRWFQRYAVDPNAARAACLEDIEAYCRSE
jgi:CDP-glucose 4,6-dehydratase